MRRLIGVELIGLLRPLGRGAPGSIHKLNWFALCFASLIHKFFNSAKTNHSSQLICSFHFYFGFIHCSFRLFCLIAFSFVRSSAAAAALNPPKIKINKTNSFHNSLSPSTIQSRFSWLGMESQRKAGDWVDGWLGVVLREKWNRSTQVGCSSFPLAGCRAAVPPLTHPKSSPLAHFCFAHSFSWGAIARQQANQFIPSILKEWNEIDFAVLNGRRRLIPSIIHFIEFHKIKFKFHE